MKIFTIAIIVIRQIIINNIINNNDFNLLKNYKLINNSNRFIYNQLVLI